MEMEQVLFILFIIPIIIKIQGHVSGIYIMVSEIHNNVDFVLSVKPLLN